MQYGEILIKGKSKKEILLSTNICHPSMGNNETSGIVALPQIVPVVKQTKEKALLV